MVQSGFRYGEGVRPARGSSRSVARLTALVLGIVVALVVAGCGSSSSGGGSSASTTAAVREIKNSYGVTKVSGTPTRVVTLGWGTTEAALAVGVRPVAIPRASGVGEDAQGYLPWVAQWYEKNGGPRPTLLNTDADIPYEDIIKAKPDLILATEAGLTKDQYNKLSKIAPTISHPGEPWGTNWLDIITISGEGLNKAAEAKKVVAGLNAETAKAAAAHPEFSGKSITALTWEEGTLYVHQPSDPRVQLLGELGFKVDTSVSGLISGDTNKLSLENTDKITSDMVVMYYGTDQLRQSFEKTSAAQAMKQFSAGTVASVVGAANVAAVSPPTALSWPWVIQPFTATLATAADHVK